MSAGEVLSPKDPLHVSGSHGSRFEPAPVSQKPVHSDTQAAENRQRSDDENGCSDPAVGYRIDGAVDPTGSHEFLAGYSMMVSIEEVEIGRFGATIFSK